MLQDIATRYDPTEDRLVVVLTFRQGEEIRKQSLWLTRRVWAKGRADFHRMIDLSAGLPAEASPQAVRAISAGNHEAMSRLIPIRKERIPPSLDAAGPDLVTHLRCGRHRSTQKWVLTFARDNKPEITLSLTDKTMHALFRLLTQQEARMDWGLPNTPLLQPQRLSGVTPLH